MKKIIILFSLFLTLNLSFGQAIVDQAVVPVAVTLQSILRLTVHSGGYIEWVVNQIADYQTGIPFSAKYGTTFSVASSSNFTVNLIAEDVTGNNLANQDGTGTLDVRYIGYLLDYDGTGGLPADYDYSGGGASTAPALQDLDGVANPIVASVTGGGDGTKNRWIIQWEFATSNVRTINTLPPLSEVVGLQSGRYVTNVNISLTAN
jgi:hypothetical protein